MTADIIPFRTAAPAAAPDPGEEFSLEDIMLGALIAKYLRGRPELADELFAILTTAFQAGQTKAMISRPLLDRARSYVDAFDPTCHRNRVAYMVQIP